MAGRGRLLAIRDVVQALDLVSAQGAHLARLHPANGDGGEAKMRNKRKSWSGIADRFKSKANRSSNASSPKQIDDEREKEVSEVEGLKDQVKEQFYRDLNLDSWFEKHATSDGTVTQNQIDMKLVKHALSTVTRILGTYSR